jgi:hypothetical protein
MTAQRHFVTDQMPADIAAKFTLVQERRVGPTRDAATTFVEGERAVREDYRQARLLHNIGKGGGGDFPAGAELVMKLPGPASAYFIAADGDGTACLYRASDVDGRLDPGRTVTGGPSFIADARERVRREQARNKQWAAGIARFWQQQNQKTTAHA